MKHLAALLFVIFSLSGLRAGESEPGLQLESLELPEAWLYADVAWGDDGRAHAVFMPSKKNRRAYYSVRNEKGEWSKPVLASGTLKKVYGMGINGPSIEVSPKGVIHIQLAFKGQIYDSRSEDGKSFRLIPLRQGEPGGTFGGSLAIDGTRVVSAWVDNRNTKIYAKTQEVGAGDIYFSGSTDDGRTFSKPLKISDMTACVCCAPNVVVHGDTIVVAYRSTMKAVKEVRLVRSSDGGKTWSKGLQVSKDDFHFPGCLEMRPDLAIGPEGKSVVVMWAAKGRYRAAVSKDGGQTFQSPTESPADLKYPLQVVWNGAGSWLAVPGRKKSETFVLINPLNGSQATTELPGAADRYRVECCGSKPVIVKKPAAGPVSP